MGEQRVIERADLTREHAERAIRNHEPCISCSPHFLDLTVDRG